MNTFIDRQLTQIKVQDLLQEAADARADRKARMAPSTPVARTLKLALAAAVPLVLWIVWAFVAG
jgi:hypothetical protein